MNKKAICLLTTLLACAPLALAQQMYKIVGPDGKVTFSDRPQIEEKTKLSVMHSYTLRAVEPPKPRVDPSARPPKPAPAPSPPRPVITPQMEDAMVTIMGLSAFGGRFEIFCSDTEAQSHLFTAAALAWKQRNEKVVEQQKKILMLVLSPAKRQELISREETLLAEEIAKISARTPASRKEWCDSVVAELNAGHSDIADPALLAVPIVPYRNN